MINAGPTARAAAMAVADDVAVSGVRLHNLRRRDRA
jgi:hypothetical protein